MNIVSRQLLRIFNYSPTHSTALCGLERTFCFKSAYSLDKLYPKSNLRLYTPEYLPEKTDKFSGYIPIEQLKITTSTSSAPGGQNVNRVNTKVDVRFHIKAATWLSEELKEKLAVQCKTRITKEGYFVIKSEVTRSQQLNLADALEKMRNIIRKVESEGVKPPISEETAEMIRKRQMKAARERLYVKRKHSDIKQSRRPVGPIDLL